MDAIQSYSSESDSDPDSDTKSTSTSTRRTTTSTSTTMLTQSCRAGKEAQAGICGRKDKVWGGCNSSHHTPPKDVLPRVRGYSAYMNLQAPTPTQGKPPDASIYGVTPKHGRTYHHHHIRKLKRHGPKSDPFGQRERFLKEEGPYHYPPPPCYDNMNNREALGTKNVGTSKYHEEQHTHQRTHLKGPEAQGNHQTGEPSSKAKRQSQGTGLTPYVPKRLRKSESQGDSSGLSSQDHDTGTTGPDIFTADPYIAAQIATQIAAPRTGCKTPRRIFRTFDSHEGPATRVQWNIPQFGHLLLSSSLDKTVRVWDYSTLRRCVQTLRCHEEAVRDAQWNSDGRQILSGGFDETARLTDVQSGTTFQVFDHPTYVTCLRWHPIDPQLFISGTFGSTIYCWDTRTGGIAHQYSGKLGQILAVEFIRDGREFVASCDTVSRDSTNRTIMVWDTDTAAVLSNQLYHEKYTCPCLRAHPTENVFLAQSNANYIALFSTQPPYRLNKYQRFEGHQVEGYSIGFDISPDGSLVASGSSDGKTHLYKYHSSAPIGGLEGSGGGATVDVAWHPVVPGVLATCSWEGKVDIWR